MGTDMTVVGCKIALAEASTQKWRVWIARYAPGLSPEQRVALAEASNPAILTTASGNGRGMRTSVTTPAVGVVSMSAVSTA